MHKEKYFQENFKDKTGNNHVEDWMKSSVFVSPQKLMIASQTLNHNSEINVLIYLNAKYVLATRNV